MLSADVDHAVEATGNSVESLFVADGAFASERRLVLPGRYALGCFLVGLGVNAVLAAGLVSTLG